MNYFSYVSPLGKDDGNNRSLKEQTLCYKSIWKQLENFSKIGEVALFQNIFNKHHLEVFSKENVKPLFLKLNIIKGVRHYGKRH